jgi:integrase
MFETTTNVTPVATDGAAGNKAGAGKRGCKESVILADRYCEKRVTGRTKIYDRKCPGLYVSITKSGVATFSFRYTERYTGKQKTVWLGVYIPTLFTVEHARTAVHTLKARIGMGENVVETVRQQKTLKTRQGMTVDELIALRIKWISELETKKDGEMRPRIETWANVASHLQRLVSPRLGKKLAADVTRDDIAELSNDIVEGRFGVKSVSNARHMRRAVSGIYRWAAEAGRNYVPVTCEPWRKLPKLPKEHERDRVLDADEIRIFWHGLDRDDMPWDRKTRLALKFALTTMLRSGELLGARRDELFDLGGDNPRFDVPLKRVKKRRVIQQPLSDLAVEIIKEALDDGKSFLFVSPFGDFPMDRKIMATALRGTRNKDGTVRTPGICALLGLKKFTPHDLRRTAATLAGDIGFSDGWIAKCLDHQIVKDENGARVPSVTGRVYSLSKRIQQKKEVLDGVATALRKIIGEPLGRATETAMPVAA